MSTKTTPPPLEPEQWCASCGAALWHYSTIYEWPSLVGLLVLCRLCAKHYNGAALSRWERPLLGYRDIKRLNERGRQ